MKTYNDTTYAILGILTTECKSGYAIKQFIDQSLNHFWKISYGQIYPTLKRIVEDGLATVSTASQEGKPERKEYNLTPKGEETLKQWLKKPIEQIPAERNEILLKLFFGRNQSNETAINHLKNYKEKLTAQYQTYQSIKQMISGNRQNEKDIQYWLFTLDYGMRMTKAGMEWCDTTIEHLVKEEG